MKRFHLTLTNNETGETLIDEDTTGVTGCICEDDGVRGFLNTHCPVQEHVAMLRALGEIYQRNYENLKARVKNLDKILDALDRLDDAMNAMDDVKKEAEDTNEDKEPKGEKTNEH